MCEPYTSTHAYYQPVYLHAPRFVRQRDRYGAAGGSEVVNKQKSRSRKAPRVSPGAMSSGGMRERAGGEEILFNAQAIIRARSCRYLCPSKPPMPVPITSGTDKNGYVAFDYRTYAIRDRKSGF